MARVISDQWTPDERLSVIRVTAYGMMSYLQDKAAHLNLERVYDDADKVTMLAEATPLFLEKNRARLLEHYKGE